MIIYSDHDLKNEKIPKEYHLFLDDIRVPSDVKNALHNGEWQEFPIIDWVVVRSFDEFCDCIKNNTLPFTVSFDHDLSIEDQNKHDYTTFVEKTGYDCAKWLVEYCLDKNLDLPEYFVHSFNPVGRVNIYNYLSNYQRVRERD